MLFRPPSLPCLKLSLLIPLRCALEGRRILLFSFGSGVMASMLALVGRAVTTTPPLPQRDGGQQGQRGGEGLHQQWQWQGHEGAGAMMQPRESSEAECEGRVAKKPRRHDCEKGEPDQPLLQEEELEVPEPGEAECHGVCGLVADGQQAAYVGHCGGFDLQSMADKV